MLVLGQFNYGKAGILDRTHTRLFTFRSLRRLLVDAGFRIKEIRGVPAPFPKILGNVLLSDLRGRGSDTGCRLHPARFQETQRPPRPERNDGDAGH
jgi:hypothetical protein